MTERRDLVILPHNADLDLLGAARCLLLAVPGAILLHPRRITVNAWNFIRRMKWFDPVPLRNIDWKRVGNVHLVGFSLPRQNPEVMEHLSRLDAPVISYSHQPARLPFRTVEETLRSHSYAAHFWGERVKGNLQLSEDDSALLLMGVTEKTWAGLSAKATRRDLDALEALRRVPLPPKLVANQVILGLREGQRGLLNDLFTQAEDLEAASWPLTMSIVKTLGNVQDLVPVMDALWSRLDPVFLVAGVGFGTRTTVFARSRIEAIDLESVFGGFEPASEFRWVIFQISDGDPEHVKGSLLATLGSRLRPDATAGEIMNANPKCITMEETVGEALEMMLRFNLPALVVRKGDSFAGVVTRRDLDKAVQMDVRDSPVGPFVPLNHPSVPPDTPARVVRSLMVRHNTTKIPVTDRGKVVGIITGRDLLRVLPDVLPHPRKFLPLTRSPDLPGPDKIGALLRRIAPLKVFHVLRKIGQKADELGVKAYAVGGFVRDLFLERPNLDVDIVVQGDAISFAGSLGGEDQKGGMRHFERFRTARLTLEGMKIDFSSARMEHYSEVGALPEVEFSGLSNDLFRRDFSINSLGLDLSGSGFLRLMDFFGGYHDLERKRIRILHPFSFLEDPTRLFRAVRFASRFHFQFTEDTRRAFDIAVERRAPAKLSLKRIGAEVERCFHEEQNSAVMVRLFESSLLSFLHKGLVDSSVLPHRFRLIPGIVRRFRMLPVAIDSDAVHWIGLLGSIDPVEAGRILQELGAPASRRKAVVESVSALTAVPSALARLAADDDPGLYDLLNPLPPEAMVALVAFTLDKRGARRVIDYLTRLRPVRCETTGRDLIALGIQAGPAMGAVFRELLRARLRGEVRSGKEELEHVKRVFPDLCLSTVRKGD